jgi:hypothetical protein
MFISKYPTKSFDISHLKQDSDGFVDYDYYQARGRQLQARSMVNLFRQAGRHLSRGIFSRFVG